MLDGVTPSVVYLGMRIKGGPTLVGQFRKVRRLIRVITGRTMLAICEPILRWLSE